jgi:hypothetical protein
MPNPLIEETHATNWHNWHRTGGVGGPVRAILKPRNRWITGPPDQTRWFEAGLAGLVSIVQRVQAEGRRVRALGSTWSLSSVAYVDDYLVDTSALCEWTLGFSAPMVEPAFAAERDRMVFAQCGTQIRTLNAHLEQSRLCLPTQGASNGQTIVGAMSTGTHGSARDVGSIQDYILGLHIVGEDGAHHWVERKTRPAMTQAFADWLGANVVRNDDVFNAAVVGFGSFGLIHGVVFAAEPVFTLSRYVRQTDYDDVIVAATTLDLAPLALPVPATPFHFEVVFNPYRRGRGDKGAFIRTYYKAPLGQNAPLPPPSVDGNATIRSPDLVNVFSFLSDAVPDAVPGLLQSQLEGSLRPTGNAAMVTGLPGQIFDDTLPTNGGTSVELGVPLDEARTTLDAIFRVTDKHRFGAPVALRYLRPSDALLAFTCHAPTTCTMEIPGIDSATAHTAHGLLYREIEDAGVRATYHWGQQGPFTAQSVMAGYGTDRVSRWIAARMAFLTSKAGRHMFSNPMLEACGLSV